MRITKSIILPINTELLIRLFSRIKVSTEYFYEGDPCWEWTGSLDPQEGYGVLKLNKDGKRHHRRAHRVMYEHFVEPIPCGLVCDHLCRVRHCVNPAHLEVVTDAENILRGEGIAPKRKAQTHCVHGHLLEGDNVGKCGTGRACKTCKKRLSREFRDRIYALPKDHPKRMRYDAMRRDYARQTRLRRQQKALALQE